MPLRLVFDGVLRIVGQAEFNSQKWEFFAKLENSKISPPKNHSLRYRAFLKWLWENGFENPLEQVWSTDFLSEKQTPPVHPQTDSAPVQLTAAAAAGIDLKNATNSEAVEAVGAAEAVEAVGAAEAGEAVEDPTPAESVHGIAPPPLVQEKPSPPSGAAPGHNLPQQQPVVFVAIPHHLWKEFLEWYSEKTTTPVSAAE